MTATRALSSPAPQVWVMTATRDFSLPAEQVGTPRSAVLICRWCSVKLAEQAFDRYRAGIQAYRALELGQKRCKWYRLRLTQ